MQTAYDGHHAGPASSYTVGPPAGVAPAGAAPAGAAPASAALAGAVFAGVASAGASPGCAAPAWQAPPFAVAASTSFDTHKKTPRRSSASPSSCGSWASVFKRTPPSKSILNPVLNCNCYISQL